MPSVGQKGRPLARAAPSPDDYPILMSTYKRIRLRRLSALPQTQLLAEACRTGWTEACGEQK